MLGKAVRYSAWVAWLSLIPRLALGEQDDGNAHYKKHTLVSQAYSRKYDYNAVKVTAVLSGNLLRLESGEKLKLIGIDIPESRFSAQFRVYANATNKDSVLLLRVFKEAREYLSSLVEGQIVRIEFDLKSKAKGVGLLGYVFLPTEVMVNAEIIRQGYSGAIVAQPNVKYAVLFQEALAEARQNKRGLWSE